MPSLRLSFTRSRARLSRPTARHVVYLVLMLLFCGYLRFVNLDWGFGGKQAAGGHPDEIIVANVIGSLKDNHFDTDLALAPLPETLRWSRYNFSSYEYLSYAWYSALFPALRHTPVLRRAGLVGPIPIIVCCRILSACCGLLVCLLAYWCARFIMPRPFALLATLFTGVLPLLVQDSHYARTEAFVTAGALGVICMSFVIAIARHSKGLLFGCPFLLGFLVASKASLGALFYLPFYAVWIDRRSKQLPLDKWKRFALMIFSGALGFLVGVPYVLPHWRAWWQGWTYLKHQYSHPFPPHGPDPAGYCFGFINAYFLHTFGAALLILAAVGLLRLLRRRQYSVLVLLVSPVVICYVVFGLQESFFERNASHVVPVIAILAAAGCAESWRQIVRIRWRKDLQAAAISLIVIACIWVPLNVSWRIAVKHFGARIYDPSPFYDALSRAVYGGRPLFIDDLYFIQSLERIQQRLIEHPDGYILRLIDANDETSRNRLAIAQRMFSMRLLAKQPGEFADLPTSTLQVYISPNYSWYLVRSNPH